MTDMTAFERRIAEGMLHRAGPIRPVDDRAVYEAVTATNRQQRWGFTMFSALKFIAASAIVALFGGFLLAGILTTPQGDDVLPAAMTESPSPMTTEDLLLTTEDLLSGMVTEEVEPGVRRVINDGYRDLTMSTDPMRQFMAGGSRADYLYPGLRAVIVGDAGNVWRTAACDAPAPESKCLRLYRVGQEGAWEIDPGPVSFWTGQIDAGLDGQLWALANGAPRVFGDGAWVPAAHHVEGDFDAITVQADGTVWLTSHKLCWTDETAAGCTSWPDVFDGGDYGVAGPVVTDEGIVWLTALADSGGIGLVPALRRHGVAGRSRPRWLSGGPHADNPSGRHDTRRRHGVDGR